MSDPVADALRARRARRRELLVQAEAVATDGRAPDAIGLPVVLLPANTRPLSSLAASRRDAFRVALRTTLRALDAVTHTPPVRTAPAVPATSPGRTAPPAPADAPLTRHAACCAVCEGACCLAGGTRAHLDTDTLGRVRDDRAQRGLPIDDAALEAAYVAYLPDTHVTDSCVFHGAAGCTLPRTLRSDLCNRHLCGALTQLDRALAASGGEAAFVVATDDVALRRAAVVSAHGAAPVPLSRDAT